MSSWSWVRICGSGEDFFSVTRDLFFYASPADAEKSAAVRAAGGRLVGVTRILEVYAL